MFHHEPKINVTALNPWNRIGILEYHLHKTQYIPWNMHMFLFWFDYIKSTQGIYRALYIVTHIPHECVHKHQPPWAQFYLLSKVTWGRSVPLGEVTYVMHYLTADPTWRHIIDYKMNPIHNKARDIVKLRHISWGILGLWQSSVEEMLDMIANRAPSQYKDSFPRKGIPITKIRRSSDRLVFIMGFLYR